MHRVVAHCKPVLPICLKIAKFNHPFS